MLAGESELGVGQLQTVPLLCHEQTGGVAPVLAVSPSLTETKSPLLSVR